MQDGAAYALVVGESLVDVVRGNDGSDQEHPGGSAANVAVALARLGRPVRLATAYADDPRGRVLASHLAGAGVALAGDPTVLGRTSRAVATLGPDGSADYDFDIEWRLGAVPVEPPPLVVHQCSLGAVLEPGAAQVRELVTALRSVATVTYDVNARPAVTGTGPGVLAAVERAVGLSDVVKASDEDLAALYPDLDLVAAARRLLGLGPAAVAVTQGGEGSLWLSAGLELRVPADPVRVVDTIGAGDTFGAALVDGLWERDLLGAGRRDALADLAAEEVEALLRHAGRAAAVTVSRPGADPPYRSELA